MDFTPPLALSFTHSLISPWDIAVMAAYFALILWIGWRAGKKEMNGNYLLGGKNIPWWAAGLSLYAAGTSGISFMAIPGKTYSTNWAYYCVNIFQVLGLIVIARWIIPAIHRLEVTSVYEYLERRFSPSVRLLGSTIFILSHIIGRNSIVLLLPALALSTVLGIDERISILAMGFTTIAYTVKGGFRAVVWTEVVQVFVMFGAIITGISYIIFHVDGGLPEIWRIADAHERTKLFDWDWSLVGNGLWIFFLYEIVQAMTWVRDQDNMQRVFSTPDPRSAAKSIWMLNLIVIPGSLMFFGLGTALFAFYQVHPERLQAGLPADVIFPYFVANEMPPGVVGLILAGIAAATMSTVSGSLNSIATALIVDFVPRFRATPTEGERRRLARIFTVVLGSVAIAIAWILAQYRAPSLFDIYLMLMGIVGGGFGAVFALGLFTRKANATGAIAGTIASIVVTLSVRLSIPLNPYMNAVIAVTTCLVVGYFTSLFFGQKPGDLTGLTVFKDVPTSRPPVSQPTFPAL